MLHVTYFNTLLFNKLKLFLSSLVVSAPLAAGILLLPRLSPSINKDLILPGIILVFFLFLLSVLLVVLAYRDYYLFFPLGLYTGKTRKEFTFASLLTTSVTLILASTLLILWIHFFHWKMT